MGAWYIYTALLLASLTFVLRAFWHGLRYASLRTTTELAAMCGTFSAAVALLLSTAAVGSHPLIAPATMRPYVALAWFVAAICLAVYTLSQAARNITISDDEADTHV